MSLNVMFQNAVETKPVDNVDYSWLALRKQPIYYQESEEAHAVIGESILKGLSQEFIKLTGSTEIPLKDTVFFLTTTPPTVKETSTGRLVTISI